MKIAYGDKKFLFQELLSKDNSIAIHDRNLQAVATEMSMV